MELKTETYFEEIELHMRRIGFVKSERASTQKILEFSWIERKSVEVNFTKQMLFHWTSTYVFISFLCVNVFLKMFVEWPAVSCKQNLLPFIRVQ